MVTCMEKIAQIIENDRDALAGIRNRDPRFMNGIVSRFLKPVSRISYRILCDRMDSESVTISLFIHIWNHPETFDCEDPLEDIVVRQTCRLCRLRLLRRRLLLFFSVNPAVYVSAVPVVPGADDFISRQAWTLYCRAARHYSDRQRIVFTLCELEGYAVGKTSQITGMSVAQVKEALSSSRELLSDELDRFGRMSDYIAYIGFLRKVEDQLTDTVRLKRIILLSLQD